MKRMLYILLLALLGLIAVPGCEPIPLPPIETYFSPKGGVTDAVVREINRAEQSVFVQAYSFTSPPIAAALVEAHRRGIEVRVILDDSQRSERYSSADFLAHGGIPVLIDSKHSIAHNKIMILDDRVVITGSFNFTRQAETHNAENLLVIRSPELAARYAENWDLHASHSEPYLARGTDATELPRPQERRRAKSSPGR